MEKRVRRRVKKRIRIVKSRFIPFILICLAMIKGAGFGVNALITQILATNEIDSTIYDTVHCPLNEINLVIDPGHGGIDGGASAIYNGVELFESDLVLDVALHLRNLLAPTGIQIAMTRETDVFISLAERERIATEMNADLFISIHMNSHELTDVSGTEVLYFAMPGTYTNLNPKHDSRLLAEKIQNRLVEKFGLRDRGIKPRGIDANSQTNMASVITEAGFMSNPNDLALISSETGLQLYAEALYLGIMDYLKIQRNDLPWDTCR